MHGERTAAYTVGHKLRAAYKVHKSVAQRKGERLREILIPLRGHGELAAQKGYAQVLWLDGVEKKYVEEVGSMNIMFKIDGKIYTAACVGTVLPGVTRRSIIELCKDWGYEVVEGKLAIADIMQAGRDGKLEEVFGTGSAAVVSPVKELTWKG